MKTALRKLLPLLLCLILCLSLAFADCPNLRCVMILSPTLEIAPDAFANAKGLTICARHDSSAAAYAQRYGFDFIAMP